MIRATVHPLANLRLLLPLILGAMLVGVPGCGGETDDLPMDELLAAFELGPVETAAAIGSLERPEMQLAAVVRLLELHPERAEQLCPALPNGPAKERCVKTRGRPHLWDKPTDGTVRSDKTAPVVASHKFDAAARVPSSFESVQAVDLCSNATDEHACQQSAAEASAREGDGRAAAQACKGVSSDIWRSECTFQAAEELVRHGGMQPGAYGQGVDLCLISGEFMPRCLTHLLMLLSRKAPAAHTGQAADWQGVSRAADMIWQEWSSRDASLAALSVQRFWSYALGSAYGNASVTGAPLDALPQSVWPHVYAAAAARLLELEGAGAYDLQGWVARLQAALSNRSVGSRGRAGGGVNFKGVNDLWPMDRPGDSDIPVIPYMGNSRRATSSNTATDLTLCVLEGAARMEDRRDGRAVEALLRAGLSHTDPVVSWTATRLIEARRKPAGGGGGEASKGQRH